MTKKKDSRLERAGVSGFNKPKRTPGENKKFAVLAKKGEDIKIVRFGDPNMTIKKDQPARRRSLKEGLFCA